MTTRCGKIAALLLLVFSAAASIAEAASGRPHSGKVRAVFDGDTVLLESGERVRYLGIDAPEVAHNGEEPDCFGDAAREANSAMVLGKTVRLRYYRETYDRYHRLLAYVYLPDGTCVNRELLRSGHACVYRTGKGFDLFPEFLAVQREAIRAGRGLWGACPVKPAAGYPANRRTLVFHREGCELVAEISTRNRVRFSNRLDPLMKGYHPCRVCKP